MMGIDPGPLMVILLYAACLAVILLVSPKLEAPGREAPSWYRNVRFWAALVAAAQIVLYAAWG